MGAQRQFKNEFALKIVGDSLEYPDDSLTYRWWMRRGTYYDLLANDTILEQDTTLTVFFAQYQDHELSPKIDGVWEDVMEYLAEENPWSGNLEYLVNQINNLPYSNDMEYNMKSYLKLYLQYQYSDGDTTYLAEVRDIADQCLFYGGPAVLEARTLLMMQDTSLLAYDWEDSCGTTGSKMDTNELVSKEDAPATWDYRLKPNLFHGGKTATITLALEESGTVEIYNIQGALVGSYIVEQGSNVLSLNKSLTSTGVYIYKVFVNSQLKHTDKLVVVE